MIEATTILMSNGRMSEHIKAYLELLSQRSQSAKQESLPTLGHLLEIWIQRTYL